MRTWLLLALLFPQAAFADEPQDERLTAGVALRVAPLEGYPVVGLSLDAMYRLGRARIGGGLTAYAPRDLGDARRFAMSFELVAQFVVAEGARARFLLGVNVGAALFWDDFVSQSHFEDELVLAPGLGFTTALEIKATERLAVVLDMRGLWYFARAITDHEWLELGGGLRLRF